MREHRVPRLALVALGGALVALVGIGLTAMASSARTPDPSALASSAGPLLRSARVLPPNQVRLELARPISDIRPQNFRFAELSAPDVSIAVREVRRAGDRSLVLLLGRPVEAAGFYRVEIREPSAVRDVRPSRWALLLNIVIASALINNFVFTRFLGLCIFFGVSKKRETALGMGATFVFVMAVTAMISWMLYTWVMTPLRLGFLQVIAFIGVVAVLVQFLDTALKKVQPGLYRKFGIYLVLITTNCIILAVPLLNAAGGSGPGESFALALGSGAGFALALFLMSCAREQVELARVPKVFQGLPIAFLLAGLFALAFSGFAGMSFLK